MDFSDRIGRILIFVFCSSIALFIVGLVDLSDNSNAYATQMAQHECKSKNNKCHPSAYCYGNDTSYECMCGPGYIGDGFVGDGHSRCQTRPLSKSRLVAFFIAFILASLVILVPLVVTIWNCARLRARMRENSEEAMAQHAHSYQEVAGGVVEAVQTSLL